MKNLLFSWCCCLSLICQGQSLEVTIIGTVHQFKKEYYALQNFDHAQQFIVELAPDLFCIEAIPPDDTASLQEILPKTLEKADWLRDTLRHLTANTFPEAAWQGAQYYARYDFWNAYFRWDDLQQKGDTLGRFTPYLRSLAHTEFSAFLFPAARRLGISELYGIDFRDGESSFLANNQQVFKQLFFRLKWKPLRQYLKTRKQYKKAEKTGTLLAYINSPAFQNAFSQLIEELPQRLPRSTAAQQTKDYWLERNAIMANRLIQTARQQNAHKVLLAIGSAHVAPIKHFLEAQGHRVHTYGEFITPEKN